MPSLFVDGLLLSMNQGPGVTTAFHQSLGSNSIFGMLFIFCGLGTRFQLSLHFQSIELGSYSFRRTRDRSKGLEGEVAVETKHVL